MKRGVAVLCSPSFVKKARNLACGNCKALGVSFREIPRLLCAKPAVLAGGLNYRTLED